VPARRVFLSYAWESEKYRSWVKQLATRLRADGIDARLDAWHLAENGNIPEFMNREVREADWVVVVCSPGYQERVRATEDGARVSGGGWEMRLLNASVLIRNQNKVLAVLAKGKWEEAAPDLLLGQRYFDLSKRKTFEAQYNALREAISGTGEKPPPLGELPLDVAEERLVPAAGPVGLDWGSAMRRLLDSAPQIIAMTVVSDLALAWFVRSSLPFSSSNLPFLQSCFLVSPVALVIGGVLARVGNSWRVRRRLREAKS
jgi:hypothetical protein